MTDPPRVPGQSLVHDAILGGDRALVGPKPELALAPSLLVYASSWKRREVKLDNAPYRIAWGSFPQFRVGA